MALTVTPATAADILALRTRYRQEMNCQITHDSIHDRPGWTTMYLLFVNGATAGFGSIAIAGPWKDKPTVFEFYLLPEHRVRAFDLFEALLATSGARFIETQSNDPLLTVMLHTFAREVATESVVFRDQITTTLSAPEAALRLLTPEEEIRRSIQRRAGGPEWVLEVDGTKAGTGGVLFHYNRPYGDIYMEVAEPFRRRGFGCYLVQQIKRETYALGAIPCARCNPANTASRKTLQKAGLAPVAHILNGAIAG